MIEQIPDIIVPLISKGNVTKHKLTEELEKIGRRRVGKECRSRWSPYH